jgi:hypothetical protein
MSEWRAFHVISELIKLSITTLILYCRNMHCADSWLSVETISLVCSKTELSSSIIKKKLLQGQDSSVDVEANLLVWLFGFDFWQEEGSISSSPRQSVSPVGTGRSFPGVKRLDGGTQLPMCSVMWSFVSFSLLVVAPNGKAGVASSRTLY